MNQTGLITHCLQSVIIGAVMRMINWLSGFDLILAFLFRICHGTRIIYVMHLWGGGLYLLKLVRKNLF